jgi:hypothetical protein
LINQFPVPPSEYVVTDILNLASLEWGEMQRGAGISAFIYVLQYIFGEEAKSGESNPVLSRDRGRFYQYTRGDEVTHQSMT